MASFDDKLADARKQSPPPVVAKLEGVFNALDDGKLLEARKGKGRRGCQGYSVEALWRSYPAHYVLNVPTVAGPVRALQSIPALCEATRLQGLLSIFLPSNTVQLLLKVYTPRRDRRAILLCGTGEAVVPTVSS